ncbi:TetR family transcriptional regulator [Actinocorallia herbida]|uniref:TetR family transcriptional regulator n=1 Tax=Actinocorallia herbida TaxID=58109 RepID=A0A3N1D220_9ACTN|nr:TetR/AcrR family transcriptional regulator [Actinocorallia herbida]ROO87536.1 TetR family transcriptional regulator [Actinocorallia herbida]
MSQDPERAPRRDAVRNRARLLDAARKTFAEHGLDVPLEEVARTAGVSRTTLYRNFATREELAATVFEDNVAWIEERAAELTGRPSAVVQLFDFVLDLQFAHGGIAHMLSQAGASWFSSLAGRTAAAFVPLLEAGRAEGVVRPDVFVCDVILAYQMAEGAMHDAEGDAGEENRKRIRAMLHRSLFL